VINRKTRAWSNRTRATASATIRCLLIGLALGACSESSGSRLDPSGTRLGPAPDMSVGRPASPHGRSLDRRPALELLDTHETGLFNRGAAEIVDYHPATHRAFVVNSRAARVGVLELGPRGFRHGERMLEPRRDIPEFGAGQVTSLAVSGDLVAVALCAGSNDRRGRVAFYGAVDLSYLGAVTVGYVPDMLTFTPDGRHVLVANEGEQVRSSAQRIVADPEGSVSIIDVSRGVESASVAQVGFAGFDARIEEYRNAGVRIPRLGDSFFDSGEGEVKLSTDLEPEYIAVAPDGRTAWVSLQENDAVAVLDVAAARFTELLPLGMKDFSRGLPTIQTAGWRERPAADTVLASRTAAEEDASARDTAPADDPLGMWFEPDESGHDREVFYLLRGRVIERVRVENTAAAEVARAATLADPRERRAYRGLARDRRDHTFWVGDARRPIIYQFAADGQLLHQLAPPEAARPTTDAAAARADSYRDPGVAAVTIDAERHRLYALLQRGSDGPVPAGPRGFAQILVFDTDAVSPGFGRALAEYLYVVDGVGRSGATREIAGVAVEPSGELLVLEQGAGLRDGASSVFRVELGGASNVLERVSAGGSLDAYGADELTRSYGIALARKTRLFDVPAPSGDAPTRLRDLALVGDGRMVVGMRWERRGARAASDAIGLVSFGDQNCLDASDRDGAVKLRHWPVFGAYMPDGIEALHVGGEDYFVTANEGDTRDYDAKRLGDVELDPVRFPDAAALQVVPNLGRLKVSTVDGDVDGDGDLDFIEAFGARSISIWNGSGNLVSDTGSLFEEVTGVALSSAFNSNNDENASFDTRSDDKGPEPEGLEIAQIDGRSYAFVGLERVGGIVVLDLTDPWAVEFVEYVNPRNFAGSAARGSARDLGPEGLKFVPAADSPTGRGLLFVANEVSGTTSAYDVNL
jgi:hypothetical protein